MKRNYAKEFIHKRSLLLYLSYFMDIQTINKMLLINKYFYEIYSNDIVWHNVFHQNFTKLRIIDRPGVGSKSLTEKNQLGKKRKRYISAMKTAKSKNLASYRPAKQDCYNVVITGFCEYMPLEGAIRDIYGKNQDIFSFFNCFFFFDETISLLSFYSSPNLTESHTVANTDCFLFSFNRNFPLTFKNFHKAEKLVTEHGWKNIVLLENIFVPHDFEKLADRYSTEEFEELKVSLSKDAQLKAPEVDEFVSKHPEVIHLKVDMCSNKVINEVFYTIIEVARQK